jgi:hypothetical protein
VLKKTDACRFINQVFLRIPDTSPGVGNRPVSSFE